MIHSNYPPGVTGGEPELTGDWHQLEYMPSYESDGTQQRLRGYTWDCRCGAGGSVYEVEGTDSRAEVECQMKAHQQEASSRRWPMSSQTKGVQP